MSRFGPTVLQQHYPGGPSTGERISRAVGGIADTVESIRGKREQEKREAEEKELKMAELALQGIDFDPGNELNPNWAPPSFNPEETHPVFGEPGRGQRTPSALQRYLEGIGGSDTNPDPFYYEPAPRPRVGEGMGVRFGGFGGAAPPPPPPTLPGSITEQSRKAFLSPEDRGLERLGSTRYYVDPSRAGGAYAERREKAEREAQVAGVADALEGNLGVTESQARFLAQYGQGAAVQKVLDRLTKGDERGASRAAYEAVIADPVLGPMYAGVPYSEDFNWYAELVKQKGGELTHSRGMEREDHRASLRPPATGSTGRPTYNQAYDMAWGILAPTEEGPPPDRDELSKLTNEIFATGRIPERSPYERDRDRLGIAGSSRARGTNRILQGALAAAHPREAFSPGAIEQARALLAQEDPSGLQWEEILTEEGFTPEQIAEITGG